jgi:hypothetical protein
MAASRWLRRSSLMSAPPRCAKQTRAAAEQHRGDADGDLSDWDLFVGDFTDQRVNYFGRTFILRENMLPALENVVLYLPAAYCAAATPRFPSFPRWSAARRPVCRRATGRPGRLCGGLARGETVDAIGPAAGPAGDVEGALYRIFHRWFRPEFQSRPPPGVSGRKHHLWNSSDLWRLPFSHECVCRRGASDNIATE